MTRMPRLLWFVLFETAAASSTTAAGSQTASVGAQFQVNSETTFSQDRPAVAFGPDGRFIVVWDGSSLDMNIRGQRFDSAGIPIGSEFQVNSYTTDEQKYPAVASDADGDFVVVWESLGSSSTDTSSWSIQAQRYDVAGSPIGDQFQVNSYTGAAQFQPAIATDSDGNFVVVWESSLADGTDTSAHSIQGQRYDAAGTPVGNQFQVNSYTTGNQYSPKVAANAYGGFVVVWGSDGSNGTDPIRSIQAQRYDSGGVPIGNEFQVNSYTTGRQEVPRVASEPDGGFVVVWRSEGSPGDDTSGWSMQARRYDTGGIPIGDQFQVNSYTTSDQPGGAVSADPDGDFVVVWQSLGSSSTDTSSWSIQAQRYDTGGIPIGDQFQVNSYTTDIQSHVAVATDPAGDFVVVWVSNGSSGTDTSFFSIQGQRYRVTGDLGDRVFFDRDYDGIQDVGETGIAGVAVYLFDASFSLADSTLTNAFGYYHFKPKPGDYYLQFELPANESFTAVDQGFDDELDSDAHPLSGETALFPVALVTADLSWDAGMANGIGDRVWLDLDGDGIQDAGEPGYGPGVRVRLLAVPGGSTIATTTTDGNSRYALPSIPPGAYTLMVDLPAGAFFTVKDAGAGPDQDQTDSDVDPGDGSSDPFTMSLGDLDLTRDAGLVTSISIGDRVWLDENGNGIQDAGEPGLGGVSVSLLDAIGNVIDSTTTDSNGFFGFTAPPGNYALRVVPPADFAFTPSDQGADESPDSDVDPGTGVTPVFTLTMGSHDLFWDAGILAQPIFNNGFESGDTSAWSVAVP